MSGLSTDLLSPDSFYSSGPQTGGRHTCCSRLRERLRTLPCWPLVALLVVFCGLVLCVTNVSKLDKLDTLVRNYFTTFADTLDLVENVLHIILILTCTAPLLLAERIVFYKCIMHSGISCYERQCQDCGGHGGAKCCGTVVAYVYKMFLASLTWLYVMLAIVTVALLGMLFVIFYEISFVCDKANSALDNVEPLLDAQCLFTKNGTCAVHEIAKLVEKQLGGCDNTPPPQEAHSDGWQDIACQLVHGLATFLTDLVQDNVKQVRTTVDDVLDQVRATVDATVCAFDDEVMMWLLVGTGLVLLGHIMMLVSFVTVWEVHAMYTRKQRQRLLPSPYGVSTREREISLAAEPYGVSTYPADDDVERRRR